MFGSADANHRAVTALPADRLRPSVTVKIMLERLGLPIEFQGFVGIVAAVGIIGIIGVIGSIGSIVVMATIGIRSFLQLIRSGPSDGLPG
jgi:hypothetical protein